MIPRLVRRALMALVTLFLVTMVLYAAIRLVPGTPWGDDESTPPERIEEWKARHHLDRALPIGYLMWVRDVLGGELGTSFASTGVKVSDMLLRAAPVSALLGILGYGAALAAAVGLGVASAARPGGAWDRLWSGFLYLLNSAPSFWIALTLQEVFAVRLGILPPFGPGPVDEAAGRLAAAASRAPYWILPPICLALGSMAFLFRFTRASLLEAAASPCVRAARARGLPEALVIGRHAFAGTLIHIVTLLGVLTPSVIAGSVIIERVFALPGLGWGLIQAVGDRDYPVVMGVGLLMAVTSVIASAAIDMLYLAVDPRLRDSPGTRP